MTRPVVFYMCHPVAAPTIDGVRDNLASAKAWLQWLTENSPATVCAPWIAAVEAALDCGVTEAAQRERGLRDCIAIIERMDGVVLVGGRVSNGMAVERDKAVWCGLHVVDLTRFGGCQIFMTDHAWMCCARDIMYLAEHEVHSKRAGARR